jgi:hypothetical protein
MLGGGLKLKVAVPLWNGLHVVSTQESAVGFKDSSSLEIANTPKAFADAIKKVLEVGIPEKPFKPLSAIYIDDQTEFVDRWLAGLSFNE